MRPFRFCNVADDPPRLALGDLERDVHAQEEGVLKVKTELDVRLGKCQEMSPCLHVMPSLEHAFGIPLCNQGNVKYTVGAVPTRISFPAEGDVSQVRVNERTDLFEVSEVVAIERRGFESHPKARRGGAGSAQSAIGPSSASGHTAAEIGNGIPSRDVSLAASHLKHKKSQLVELKDQLLRGEIRYPAYIRKAVPLQKEIRELEAEAS